MAKKGKVNALLRLATGIDKANKRAVNRAAKSTVTGLSGLIRERYNIQKKELDKRLILRTGSGPTVKADLIIKGGSIPLIDFKPKQVGKIGRPRRKKSTKSGVKATVIKGRRQLFRSTEAGAFIQTMKSGHEGVFIRSSEKMMKSKPDQAAIFELFGVDLTQLVVPKSSNKMILRYVEETFASNYRRRIEHEVGRLVK